MDGNVSGDRAHWRTHLVYAVVAHLGVGALERIGVGAVLMAVIAGIAGRLLGGSIIATVLLGLAVGAVSSAAAVVMATLVPDAIRITDPPDNGRVVREQAVAGRIRPLATVNGLQVFVFSRGGGYYLQAAATVTGRWWGARTWSASCVFGNPDAPPGTPYVVVAMSGANVRQQKTDTLPEGAGILRSRNVPVTLVKRGS